VILGGDNIFPNKISRTGLMRQPWDPQSRFLSRISSHLRRKWHFTLSGAIPPGYLLYPAVSREGDSTTYRHPAFDFTFSRKVNSCVQNSQKNFLYIALRAASQCPIKHPPSPPSRSKRTGLEAMLGVCLVPLMSLEC
jgi:hypothetical protein